MEGHRIDSRDIGRFNTPQRPYHCLSSDDYTIGWICALSIELAAVRAVLDEDHSPIPTQQDDSNTYVLGRIGHHNVAIACLPTQGYGMNNAAIVASNMRRSFSSIRICLMVGIGGGAPVNTDVRLGDVVVGTKVIQYDLGKTSASGFMVTATPRVPPHEIMTAIATLQSRHELRPSNMASILAEMRKTWPEYADCTQLQDHLHESSYVHNAHHATCDSCDRSKEVTRQPRNSLEPRIHYGVVACANRVMKDGKMRDQLAEQFDILCFEMEAAGLVDSLPTLSIRGICDYADSHKNKSWQRYAAGVAAAYAKEWLTVVPPNEAQQSQAALVSGAREDLLDSLRFKQIDTRKKAIQRAQPHTCEWLFNHHIYNDWLDLNHFEQHHGFLWIKGKPGTGKSTLMKHALLRAQQSAVDATTLSFFFNARGHELEKNILGMHQSLLFQLLKALPDLRVVLDGELRIFESEDGISWTVDLLRQIFTAAVELLGQRRVICFIDALDECDRKDVRDMVSYFEELEEMALELSIPLFICFSSRHYPSITIEYGLSITLEDQTGHSHDMETYVERRLRLGKSQVAQDIRSKVLLKANGVFLWLILVVDILNETYSDGALFRLQSRLDELPQGLSELFKMILIKDNKNTDELLLCLQWILFAARPLLLDEFYIAIVIGILPEEDRSEDWYIEIPSSEELERFIVSSSKGLAEVATSYSGSTVQFIHESVRDFLIRDNGLRQMWPHLVQVTSESHDRLKTCCLSYTKVISKPERHRLISDAEERKEFIRTHLWRSLFAPYTFQYLLHHANEAACTIPQDKILSEIDTKKYLGSFKRYYKGNDTFLMSNLARHGWNRLVMSLLALNYHQQNFAEQVEEAIFATIESPQFETFKLLLNQLIVMNKDVKPNLLNSTRSSDSSSSLSCAVRLGRTPIVRMLIEAGANIDNTYHEGRNCWSLLTIAANYDYVEIVKCLLSAGAEINAADSHGETALFRAAALGYTETVKLLLDSGADCTIRNSNGDTVLDIASENDHKDVELIISTATGGTARKKTDG